MKNGKIMHDVLALVAQFSRMKAYSGVMPCRLLATDREEVDQLVHNKLLERKSVRMGGQPFHSEGVALTPLGRRTLEGR